MAKTPKNTVQDMQEVEHFRAKMARHIIVHTGADWNQSDEKIAKAAFEMADAFFDEAQRRVDAINSAMNTAPSSEEPSP
ncbi:MAG: hypothetical protein V3W41_22555 [Planctomycetota bacterium]